MQRKSATVGFGARAVSPRYAACLPIVLLVLLASVSFAQPPSLPTQASWQLLSAAAVMAAILIVALLYMAGYLLDHAELRVLALDELWQTLASLAILLVVVGGFAALSGLAPGMAELPGVPSDDLLAAATHVTDRNVVAFSNMNARLAQMSGTLGAQAAQTGMCYFVSTGFSLNVCGGLNAVRGPLANAQNAAALALTDLYAQRVLLDLFNAKLLALILPFGFFLRAFRLTRAAGSALLAIGIGFAIVFPSMVVLNERFVGDAIDAYQVATATDPADPSTGKWLGMPPENAYRSPKCDPFGRNDDPFAEVSGWEWVLPWNILGSLLGDFSAYDNPDWPLESYLRYLSRTGGFNVDGHTVWINFADAIVFQTVVHGLFCTVLALFVTLAFITVFAHLLGAEIDVSSLVKIS